MDFEVEVIRHSTEYIAEEMGIVLRNTAYSPNIRDRMDFSCAIASARGEIVAQAEHIPVHLGSMAVGIKEIVKMLDENSEGDVFIVNDPYIAGTHLNDITLIKPIFQEGEVVCYVANKAHHVDVGGVTPGSLGIAAKELIQEGLVIPPTKLVDRGKVRQDLLNFIASNVRVPRYTLGDIKAQIASLNVGERRVRELIRKYGVEKVVKAWEEAMNYTERFTRAKISELPKIESEAVDYMELGEELLNINVRIEVKDRLVVDFSGTHEQVDVPLNAVFGVTVASTSFALKCVLDPELPMNYGFYRAVEIYAPEGTLVNPRKPAPVSVGNVETSQRIADVVFKALSKFLPVPAASCGSMNNVVIGGKDWALYETIGGGSGARPGKDGVNGVHTNMTNTMNTPVEVVEREYPIMILEYSLRDNSGGSGKYKGGMGIRRVYRVLEDATLSLVAERVKLRPWGLNGGEDGKPGEHYIVRNGEIMRLSGKDVVSLSKGDVVVINTPGGGGYGSK